MGRVPALEIMFDSGAIKDCIIDPDKTAGIMDLMEAGSVQYGMQTFDQSIMALHKQGLISFEEAMSHATNPDDFDLRLRGISGSADRWKDEDGSSDAQPNLGSSSDYTKH